MVERVSEALNRNISAIKCKLIEESQNGSYMKYSIFEDLQNGTKQKSVAFIVRNLTV